ncbi:phosphoribosylaminoimidazolesuccinocarboxamide synthase [candidate division KSB1 bacterium]
MTVTKSNTSLLQSKEAEKIVEQYIIHEEAIVSTQELLDSGAIPRLKGYKVQPGKVSDSVYGGKGSFYDKKSGGQKDFENPPLDTPDGIPIRIMVRTSRISTHDINRGEVPFKDQILAINHNFMRRLVTWAIGTSQFEIPDLPDSSIVIAAENLKPVLFENVLRAYNAKSTTSTSLYQHFIKGEREFCGHKLPNDLLPNGPLPYVMDTPSTKAENDESLSRDELFMRGICTPAEYTEIINGSLIAFGVASEFLRGRGIILVDFKLEHGTGIDGTIKSMDEIITMDSSRFWLLDDYNEQSLKLAEGEIEELAPKSYSKEFARGFSEGDKGYTDEQRAKIAVRYIEGIQHLLGTRFEPDTRPRTERITTGIDHILNTFNL